jgi:hypothetical protein
MGGKSKSTSTSQQDYTTNNLNLQGVDGLATAGDGNSVNGNSIDNSLTDSRSFTDSRNFEDSRQTNTTITTFDGGTAKAAIDAAENISSRGIMESMGLSGAVVKEMAGVNDAFMDGARYLASDAMQSSDRAAATMADLVGRAFDSSRNAISQAGATINSVARGDAGEYATLLRTALYVAGAAAVVYIVLKK